MIGTKKKKTCIILYELFAMNHCLICNAQFSNSIQKSENLQYDTLVCWSDRTNDSATKSLKFQVSFLIIFYRHSKLFIFILVISWKKYKNRLKGKILWKKIIFRTSEAWMTSRLSHRPSEQAYYIVDWWILCIYTN